MVLFLGTGIERWGRIRPTVFTDADVCSKAVGRGDDRVYDPDSQTTTKRTGIQIDINMAEVGCYRSIPKGF